VKYSVRVLSYTCPNKMAIEKIYVVNTCGLPKIEPQLYLANKILICYLTKLMSVNLQHIC